MSETIAALVAEIDQMMESKDSMIRAQSGEIERAWAAYNDVKAQLDTARRAFGSAFTKGYRGPTGPDRPNRKKLTAQEVKDIRQAFRGGMKQRDLARNYGVNPATISRTVRGIYH
ncbi:helix-turn-helix DNA-binding domain protein [Mycobacterium phage Refuge]|uniref:Helix-turn-helix DNA-binding domain protein n=1 Tax=Mycobacterium phage Refuge TaxID=2517967 RepID=A0A482JEL1_9CAUD|nr:HTH DNA binding protein [Mycobacterium phage Refuge]QBP31065.1 helix-turn-helix DNA-binding domain protein [Mycobacterium phage Refuge]